MTNDHQTVDWAADPQLWAAIVNPTFPTGPLPPTPPTAIGSADADLAAWAKGVADIVVGVATAMSWGATAADAVRTVAAEAWARSESADIGDGLADTFRFLKELGRTPATAYGVAHLLRLAHLIRDRKLQP